jgi:hypothetical protein
MELGQSNRLPPRVVERLHCLLGGDPVAEGMVLWFIRDKYGARNLLQLTPDVAGEILNRPVDFIRAAKRHCVPELEF